MGVRIREKPKDSGVWWVFIHHEGRRTSRRVGGKKEALEVGRQIRAKLVLGQDALTEREAPVPTLDEYYGHIKKTYLETGTRPATQAGYENSFKNYINTLGSKRLDAITKANVRTLIGVLMEKGLAKASIKTAISHLSAVLNHAVEDEIIIRNPAVKCSKF